METISAFDHSPGTGSKIDCGVCGAVVGEWRSTLLPEAIRSASQLTELCGRSATKFVITSDSNMLVSVLSPYRHMD